MRSPPRRLLRGARSLLRGVRETAGHRGVRSSLVVIFLALFALSIGLTAGGLATVPHVISVGESDGWTRLGLWTLRVMAWLFVILLAPLLSLTTVNLLAPVFAELPFLAGLAHLSPEESARLSASAGLGLSTSIINSTRRLLPFVLRSFVFFLLGFVPIVGPPAALVGQLHNSSKALGWELLDPYFDKAQIPFAEQRRIVASLHWERMGLGLAATPLLSIPFVGPLFFPFLQAGAARFVVDFLLTPIDFSTVAARSRSQLDPGKSAACESQRL